MAPPVTKAKVVRPKLTSIVPGTLPVAFDFTDGAKPKPTPRKVTNKSAKPKAKGVKKPKAKSTKPSSKSNERYDMLVSNMNNSLHKANPALKGFGSTSGQNKELRVQCTEFLDFTATPEKPILNYVFNDKQQYFSAGPVSGSDSNISRLEKIEVWALPKSVNAAVATSSYAAMFATPCLRTGTLAGEVPRSLSQRTTFINPTFNTKWVKVGMSDFRKLFSDALVRPVYTKQNETIQGVVGFQLTLIDPDDQTIQNGPVQLKVKITYVQTLPVETTVSVAIDHSDSFIDIPTPVEFTDQFAIMELKSLTDRT